MPSPNRGPKTRRRLPTHSCKTCLRAIASSSWDSIYSERGNRGWISRRIWRRTMPASAGAAAIAHRFITAVSSTPALRLPRPLWCEAARRGTQAHRCPGGLPCRGADPDEILDGWRSENSPTAPATQCTTWCSCPRPRHDRLPLRWISVVGPRRQSHGGAGAVAAVVSAIIPP